MGTKIKNENQPLRNQFINSFSQVLGWSLLCSVISWGIIYLLFTPLLQPANHYEKKLNTIYHYVDVTGSSLLDVNNRSALEEVIPTEGIEYVLYSSDGKPSYGTLDTPPIFNATTLYKKMNTQEMTGNQVTMYYPIIDKNTGYVGTILLQYTLNLASSNPNQRPLLLFTVITALLIPFLYLFLFTLLYGYKLEKKISPSIQRLVESAQKIEQSNLDFTIKEIGGAKELETLGQSFEKMRQSLHTSLLTQWRLEQGRHEMVAALSHDLNTPLTIIQGHVDGLLTGGITKPKRVQQYLTTIQNNTYRSVRLLREIEEVYKLEHPEFTLYPIETDLYNFFIKKEEEYSVLSTQKQIQLKVTGKTHLLNLPNLRLDPFRIAQIIDNIMVNCLRYTPSNGFIHWTIAPLGNGFELTVTDSGPGLSKKDLNHLFDPFYQGDPSRSLEHGHAGLGLTIAQKLALKHGGSLSAHNTEEAGASFNLKITEIITS
ncbi:cell wall metabolism sensor histidine kinase WalK [Mechercharimyces sp. CAU 1602]|uniref:sensor histidine kinase n=1 Tax=Mechercharimyces sp. CAU 1602 TaxID=2973933 RepID=UPI002162F030|nr:HAMP domain-containing sensor histidine kinase [Mechercharimyces sp. CAU 1602]MCS1350674.1 HAMP domain-containing histidine kinase [Mechercharimyces sp. CAU 1602]